MEIWRLATCGHGLQRCSINNLRRCSHSTLLIVKAKFHYASLFGACSGAGDGGEIWHGGGDLMSPRRRGPNVPTEGPLLRAKFHPHRCNDKGIGAPKLKFLLRFDQNVEYKHPPGAYPLRDLHKICKFCTPFQDALAVKISWDLLKGLWSYGGLS